jgi:hypothetical protein
MKKIFRPFLVLALLLFLVGPVIPGQSEKPATSDITVDSITEKVSVDTVDAVTEITNPIDAYIKDPATGDYTLIDTVFTAPVRIATEHHEMHEGDHYFIKTWLINTGADETFDTFSFTTPDTTTRIHAKTSISSDADAVIEISEGATVTGGVAGVGVNNDRDSANTPTMTLLVGPTISVAGDLIWGARTGGGRGPVGVGLGSNYEIIAKRNTTYTFKIIKKTSADTVSDIDFWWYEHVPDN